MAITDPLSVPNNKVGIHILFPGEVHLASKMINDDSRASWGYVTVPIQATDRDPKKWQEFLDKCKQEKVIPLVRVATTPNGSNWDEPNNYDLVDFANFLNDLKWPVQNRYIIIFNEVNRPDEYGGVVNPEKYADILNNAVDIFKVRSEDFFILPAGLDNAASNQYGAIHWQSYLRRMWQRQPKIFDKIDGWTSHAYPNPEFTVRPDLSGPNKIDSYRYDLKYLLSFTSKKLPVFITETGWSDKYLSEKQISYYYDHAFSKVWTDASIVAVTPFLLNAQDGPFKQFSFMKQNESAKEYVAGYSDHATVGSPSFTQLTPTPVIIIDVSKSTPSAAVLGSGTDSFDLLKKLYNNLKLLLGLLN